MMRLLGRRKVNRLGVIVALVILLGLLGPWITLDYDSYPVFNLKTRLGEKHYHARIELSPFFGTLYRDRQMVTRIWYLSTGTAIGGAILAVAAILTSFRYSRNWANFMIFFTCLGGLVVFFLSLGRGISVGVFTHVGWGLGACILGIFLMFLVSFIEITRNSVSRFIDR